MVLYTPVVPEIRRPKQEDCEFKGSLYTVRYSEILSQEKEKKS